MKSAYLLGFLFFSTLLTEAMPIAIPTADSSSRMPDIISSYIRQIALNDTAVHDALQLNSTIDRALVDSPEIGLVENGKYCKEIELRVKKFLNAIWPSWMPQPKVIKSFRWYEIPLILLAILLIAVVWKKFIKRGEMLLDTIFNRSPGPRYSTVSIPRLILHLSELGGKFITGGATSGMRSEARSCR